MTNRAYMARKFGPTVTNAELILHQAMAGKGWRFKSQWRIQTANGKFTVDFLVYDKVILEPRGSSHFGKTARRKDSWKTMELLNAGYLEVMWIDNIDIYKRLPQVLERIESKLVEHNLLEVHS